MFSRAAKSVVKSFGQRKYYAGEDNLKITLIGTIEGVNLNASRLARQHSTLNTIPIYDVAGINKGFLFIQNRMRHFNGAEPFCGQNSRMLTLMEKSRSYETTSKQDTMMKDNSRLPYLTDQLKVNETDINKLVEALHCLPIGEEARAVNQHFTSPKAGDTCTSKLRSMMTRILDEMGHNNTTRRVRQKNDILSEMTEWLLRPIDPYGEIANATTFSTSSTRKEKKLTKKTISKRCHKKKVRKLPIVASVVKITPFKKSEDKFSTLHLMKKKLKIHMDKCVKRNNDKEQRKDEERVYKTNVKNKLKDWTVPAAFTNKKSRLLYNFSKANDKARSSWFLSKVLDGRNIQNDDSIKLKRFIATSAKAKPRLYDIIKDDKKCNTDSEKISTEDEKLINLKSKSLSQIVPLNHVTLSMEDLRDLSGAFISDFYTRTEKCKFQEEPLERSLMEVQMISEDVDHLSDENERLSSFFQRKETENNFCKKWRPVERVSSAVRSLLENVRRKKIIKKSNSSLSVDSYHLDDFFKLRPSSADLTTNLFSDVNEEVLNDWLERNLYSSCNKIPQDPCTCLKKRQGLGGKHDSCKKNPCAKPDPCKKDPCAKPDPCKKDPCAKPDPCKKDPCAKPDPCKKDPCAKPDPCKKDPCKKPDPCKKDPCKKPDPCPKADPCKKPDPCPKPDPCKKSDPCPKPDPCKKPDPCPKPDPCKKPDPCPKPDPCKKPDPCPKLDPCKKKKTSCATLDSCPKRNSCTSEKVECPEMKKTDDTCVQKQCPPVIRAPGCPNNTKGGDKKCRTPSIYYFKDEFLYEKLFKKKYLKFLFPDKNMLTKEIDIIKKSNVKRIKTNMELPKLYTLDTFGINYNIED